MTKGFSGRFFVGVFSYVSCRGTDFQVLDDQTCHVSIYYIQRERERERETERHCLSSFIFLPFIPRHPRSFCLEANTPHRLTSELPGYPYTAGCFTLELGRGPIPLHEGFDRRAMQEAKTTCTVNSELLSWFFKVTFSSPGLRSLRPS